MKKSLVMFVLAFAVAAAAQTAQQQSTPPAAGQQAGQAQPGQAQPAQAGPTIKDPAEYNAYITAFNQTDPTAKAQALEAFLQQYPNSVMKVQALELLMAAYQQANNPQKTVDAAQRVLQADPNNLRALAVLTFINRQCALAGGPNAVQCLNDAGRYGQQGLSAIQTAQAPAGVSADDWTKLKTQTSPIFNSAVGLAALQSKNYPAAQQALSAAVQANPNDFTTVYQLAIAYLSQKPVDPKGLWWVAKAVNLAQGSPAQAQIANYGKRAYTVYHGGEDGWDQLVASAGQGTAPPPDLNIAPAPTPAEQAAKLCQTKQVKDMSFDEFQMIFSNNAPCADQVWNQIKGKPIAFEGKVVQTGKDQLSLAATYDDIQSNTADVTITFPSAIPASLMPQVGSMAKVQGSPTQFTPQPFMIQMDQGAFIGKKMPPAASKGASKAATKKGTTTHRKKK